MSFMLHPQFWEMSTSTMSQQGRALCHPCADGYGHKHIGCTHQLKLPERTSDRKREGGRGRQQHTGGKRTGRGSQGVRLGNTSAAYQSQLLASLPLLPWQQRTVRHPGGRDGPKNLQLSLTSGERRNGASVCPAWLRYHFISTEEMLNRKDETLSMSQSTCDDRK